MESKLETKVVDVIFDVSATSSGSAVAYQIAFRNIGAVRGESFPGDRGAMTIPECMGSVDSEAIGGYYVCHQVNRLASILKIDKSNEHLRLHTDCERLVSLDASKKATSPATKLFLKTLISMRKRWKTVELLKMSRSRLRVVDGHAKRERKKMQKLRIHAYG